MIVNGLTTFAHTKSYWADLTVFDGVGLVSLKRMKYILRKPKQSHENPS